MSAIGASPVDPTVHELLFERFISEDRDEPPDIDVDLSTSGARGHQHIYHRYGRHHAGMTATVIITIPAAPSREVGKTFGPVRGR